MKTFKQILLAVALLGVSTSLLAATWRIEPEFFPDQLAWTHALSNNTAGKNAIVSNKRADNTLHGEFQLTETGTYHIWVRTFGYGQKQRKVAIILNGQEIGAFGDVPLPAGEKPRLDWEKSKGTLELAAGKLTIDVKPLSEYARIDCVLLTTDAAFVPASTASQINLIPELTPFKQNAEKPKAKPAPKVVTFPHPQLVGNGDPILLLAGGRPWTGTDFGGYLKEAGAKILTLTSKHLAGFGGSPIRDMLGDAYEPTPADGITPEFQQLARYKVVIFNNIPAECQARLFTPERVEKLKKYVADGGAVVLTMNAPKELGDLLPVTFTSEVISNRNAVILRPTAENFAFLPKSWPAFNEFKRTRAKGGVISHSQIEDAERNILADYIVEMNYGKGKVIFLNGEFARKTTVVQFYSWAYGRALMAALVKQAGCNSIEPTKLVAKKAVYPDPKTIDAAFTTPTLPQMTLTDVSGNAMVKDNCVTFANGAKLEVNPNGDVSLTWPNETKPRVTNFKAPQLLLATTQQNVNDDTSEAVGTEQKMVGAVVWTFKEITTDKSRAILRFASANGAEMEWIFKTGTLTLDGRSYTGFAQKARIPKAPMQVNALETTSNLDINATFARRMDCYQPPRGYDEPDLSGAVTADTRPNNFFCDSQPFGYINTRDGIFVEFLEEILPTTIRFSIQKGEKAVTASERQLIGRRNAPVEGAFFWMMYSNGVEHSHSEYIALWQFVRHQLRKRAGLKEFNVRPCAAYANTCSLQEIQKTIKRAGEMGFSEMHLPLCPSSIDSLDSPQNSQIYLWIKDAGMVAHPWSAGDYTCGTGDPLYQEHKDWLMKDEKGEFYSYFGNHRVLDLGNKDFVKWYFEKLDKCFSKGVGYVYLDMGGQASTNVNFEGKESLPGLLNQIPVFKYYHDHNVRCGVEGMNPLVLDNYWYRPKLYKPFGGKEFAMIGARIGANEDDNFCLNFFRTVMYGATVRLHIDGYTYGFERAPNEIEDINHVAKLFPAIQKVLDFGLPFIRREDFGTSWINEKGGALFVWDNVKHLTVNLPAGYRMTTVQKADGSSAPFTPDALNNVQSETIFVFEKQ